MQIIGGLLDRFKNLEPPERVVRDAVVSAIDSIIDIQIEPSSINMSNNGILYISVQSSVKASVFEQKDIVISRINNLLNRDKVKDIK